MDTYWKSENATIYNRDCLETLRGMEDNSVDVVVTSPPYNQLGKRIPKKPTGIHRDDAWLKKVSSIGYADDMPENDYQTWLSAIVKECLRVAKGLVWINHKTRYRNKQGIIPCRILPFPIYSEIIWDRGGSMVLNANKFAPSHEYIYGFGAPHYWHRPSNRLMSVWRIGAQRGNADHPCPFPLTIPKRLIEASCPEGGIVLDPFSGSATTGIAALELGRRYIGIEKDKAYCDTSINRLSEVINADIFN